MTWEHDDDLRLRCEEVLRLIQRARADDEHAFKRLIQCFHKPLVGLIRRVTDCGAVDAEATANATWRDKPSEILRAPEAGGYQPDKHGLFHSFVFNHCMEWTKAFNGEPPPIGPWPVDDEGQLLEFPDPKQIPSCELVRQLDVFKGLLYLILDERTGYPHQQLALILSRYMYGEPSPRGMEGKADKVDENHGETPLSALTDWLADQLAPDGASTHSVGGWFEHCASSLRKRLTLSVGTLLVRDPQSMKFCNASPSALVGDTCLRHYYANHKGGHRRAIALWSNKVIDRIYNLLGLPDDPTTGQILDCLEQRAKRRWGRRWFTRDKS